MLDLSSHQTLLKALSRIFSCIGRINLDRDELHVLHQAEHPEEVGNDYCYSTYIQDHAEELGHISELYLEHLMPQELKSVYLSGRENFELTMPDSAVKYTFYHEHDPVTDVGCDWAYIYIVLNEGNDLDLLRIITNEYLFKSCDYFVYIDPFRDSYVTFASSSGTPVPPASGDKYSQEVVKYARAHVPVDEQEEAIREMTMPRVIAELNRKGSHVFYSGVIEPERGYTRKRVEYRYCDANHTAILLIRTDVTDLWNEEQERVAKLQHALEMAYTDLLTKVLNKQGFLSKADTYLTQLKGLNHSKADSSAAVIFLDLDNFKPVNDTYGHQVGDSLLQSVAAILRQSVNPDDLIGRYGGDEFILLIKQVRNVMVVSDLAQKILTAIASLNEQQNLAIEVTGSMGAALAPTDGYDLNQLIYIADQRLYMAKHRGKNMAVFEDEPTHATANDPEELSTEHA